MKLRTNGKFLTASSVLAVALMVGGGSLTAFAASAPATDGSATVSYSYLTGQQENSDRYTQYAAVSSFTTDEEREAYFEAQGIGGDGSYSAAQHLDAEALMEAGVIDQSTADQIVAYASQKHDDIHALYANKSSMTADERQAMYESMKKDGFDGDSVSELINAGIITQEQADSINTYIAGTSAQ
ncbi:hypothetical protein [Clostridium kluyveri]|nr:hypothetical protein [Clostridium kluyveri]